MNLGSAISSIRKRKGIRQSQMAQAIDITQGYLSLIEQNKKDPNLSTLKLIAQYLDIPLAGLMIIALERTDVREDRIDLFDKLYPILKDFVMELFQNDQPSTIQND